MTRIATAIGFALVCAMASRSTPAAAGDESGPHHDIAELTPLARLHLGKSADWVAVTEEAIWVGTKQPNGVAQIDPRSNKAMAAIVLPGNPCAGLAVGFGALWVPLCAKPNALARVDLQTHGVTLVPGVGTADREGGIAVSKDSVWLVVDAQATLARIDPATLMVEHRTSLPRGSLNVTYGDGLVWVSRPTRAEITAVDAVNGAIVGSVHTGPHPRFLDTADGNVWTLNQGDGTLTRINTETRSNAGSTALHTPGPGGDIKLSHGIVWTTMNKVPLSATDAGTGKVLCQWAGAGGDSLGVSEDAIWITDYDAGDVVRYALADVLAHCRG